MSDERQGAETPKSDDPSKANPEGAGRDRPRVEPSAGAAGAAGSPGGEPSKSQAPASGAGPQTGAAGGGARGPGGEGPKPPAAEPEGGENAGGAGPGGRAPGGSGGDGKISADKVVQAQSAQRRTRQESEDYSRVVQTQMPEAVQASFGNVSASSFTVNINETRPATDTIPLPDRDAIEVSPEEHRKIQQVYQRHAGYPKALEALHQTHCVVLQGNLHVGKRAAAVRLAQELLGETGRVRELSPEESLEKQLESIRRRPSTVFLVDDVVASVLQSLKPLAARGILDLLRRESCYLIVCARSAIVAPRDLSVVRLEPLALSTLALLELHLEYWGASALPDLQPILDDPAITEVLAQDLCPYQVDFLAKRIAEVVQAGRNASDALQGYSFSVEPDVRDWFDETAENLSESAFRVALAVFGGVPYTAIDNAAKDLATRLQPEPVEPQPKIDAPPIPRPSPFTKPRLSQRLDQARAHEIPRTITTEYSERATIMVAELNNPAYTPALLKYLWSEFADLRQPLLEWLGDYALNSTSDMRVRAAGAVGKLGEFDFEFIRGRVFRAWAIDEAEDSDDRRRRYQALGNALGVLVWSREHTEDVLGLLRAWIDSDREPLQWAAARAYAQVGLRYPREAMNQWRRLLETRTRIQFLLTPTLGISLPHPLHMSIVDAIISLFLKALEWPNRLRPVYEQALEGLAAWVDADKKDKNSEDMGLPLFLALTPIHYPSQAEDMDEEDWLPAMLVIVSTQPDSTYRRLLAGLWREALRRPGLRDAATEALYQWTACADRHDWLEESLAALLREMLSLPDSTERLRNYIVLYLGRWARHPKRPLAVAGRLLGVVSQTGSVPLLPQPGES